MKKSTFLSIVLIGIMLITACKKEDNQGELTTEIRTLEHFTSIHVQDAIIVYITKGDTDEVKIETSSSYIPHIITEVNAGILNVSVDNAHMILKPDRHHEIKVYVTIDSLNSIEASGACSVSCTGSFESDTYKIVLSGASKLSLDSLHTGNIYIDASGASEIELKGSTNTLNISSLSGASVIKAQGFTSENVNIDISGASEATVNVNLDLNVVASGASEVKYMGNPLNIKQDLSGASQLIKL